LPGRAIKKESYCARKAFLAERNPASQRALGGEYVPLIEPQIV
jgi:hypothetical protein